MQPLRKDTAFLEEDLARGRSRRWKLVNKQIFRYKLYWKYSTNIEAIPSHDVKSATTVDRLLQRSWPLYPRVELGTAIATTALSLAEF